MGFRNGKWIHHKNCTYCIYRNDVPIGKKGRRIIKQERCDLHNRQIPPPFEEGRYCEGYVQRGCGCENCVTNGSKG